MNSEIRSGFIQYITIEKGNFTENTERISKRRGIYIGVIDCILQPYIIIATSFDIEKKKLSICA